MLAKLCKGINLYFRISCPKGLKADEDVVFEEVAGKISLGVFGTVKAVEYLYVFIADEEVFGQGSFNSRQEGLAVVRIYLAAAGRLAASIFMVISK